MAKPLKDRPLETDPSCCSRTMERCYRVMDKATPRKLWLAGWWCRQCQRYERAIGREHQL